MQLLSSQLLYPVLLLRSLIDSLSIASQVLLILEFPKVNLMGGCCDWICSMLFAHASCVTRSGKCSPNPDC